MILTFGKYVHLLQGMVHFLKLGLLTTTDSGIGCCPPAPPRLASWKQSSPLPPAEVVFATSSTVEIPQRWVSDGHRGALPRPYFFPSYYRVCFYRSAPGARRFCPPLVSPATGVREEMSQVTAKVSIFAFHGRFFLVVCRIDYVEC